MLHCYRNADDEDEDDEDEDENIENDKNTKGRVVSAKSKKGPDVKSGGKKRGGKSAKK